MTGTLAEAADGIGACRLRASAPDALQQFVYTRELLGLAL